MVAPVLSRVGVPGYAAGGTPTRCPPGRRLVNPVGSGLRGERVDMGVDYGGSGPLYALGAGGSRTV